MDDDELRYNNGEGYTGDSMEETAEQLGGAASSAGGNVKQKADNAAGTAKDYAVSKAKEHVKDKIEEKAQEKLQDQAGKAVEKVAETAQNVEAAAQSAKGAADAAAGSAQVASGAAKGAAGAAAMGAAAGTKTAASAVQAAGTDAAVAVTATVVGAPVGVGVEAATIATSGALNASAAGMDQAGKKAMESGQADIQKGSKNIQKGAKELQSGMQKQLKGKINTSKPNLNKIANAINMGDESSGDEGAKIPNIPKSKKDRSPRIGAIHGITKGISVKQIMTIIGIVFIVFALVVVLIIASAINIGKYKEGDKSNVPYVVSSSIIQNIEIASDGEGGFTYGFKDEDGNVISLDEACKNALKILKDNSSTAIGDLGKNEEEQIETIKLFVRAEIATQYPDIKISATGNADKVEAGTAFHGTPTASVQWGWLIQNELINAYYYEHDLDNIQYNAYAVKGYITEDRKDYIVVSNSTGLYIGQGIQLYANGAGWNTNNLDLFKQYGVNTSNLKDGDKINADICDKVSQTIFENTKASIEKSAKKSGLSLNENQIVALVDWSYLNGPRDLHVVLDNISKLRIKQRCPCKNERFFSL